jgi:hypothetical protein
MTTEPEAGDLARVGPRSGEVARIEDHEWPDRGSNELAHYVAGRQVTFREAIGTMDIVEARHDPAHGSYVVMADRTSSAPGPSIRELGYSSPSPFTAWTREEWNPKLRDRQGLREYYRMKRQDGAVRGGLRLLKTPIQAGRWFVEAGSDSARDQKIAEFVQKNLFEYMSSSWSTFLDNVLLMCEYGHMVFEKVWAAPYGAEDKVRDGKLRLRKLAPRHPLDVRDWRYDDNGGPDGVVMEPTEMSGYEEGIFIPIEKLAVFALEAEAGDLRGISVLRSAYKHYYYKDTLYKIDAIQKERHGIGVPIVKLPPGYNDTDKRLADEIGRNLRTNEKSHIVVPPGWEILFAKLEGQPVDCLGSINHHNMQIMSNILAPFQEDSSVDPKSTDMFLKSTRYIALAICDVVNHHIIPQLVAANFILGANRCYPALRVRRIGEWEDIRTMSFAFRNFVGADGIRADDPLEDFFRKELDLPPRDPATARKVVNGGDSNEPDDTDAPEAGLPRQAKPKAQPAKKSQGRDRSGG